MFFNLSLSLEFCFKNTLNYPKKKKFIFMFMHKIMTVCLVHEKIVNGDFGSLSLSVKLFLLINFFVFIVFGDML